MNYCSLSTLHMVSFFKQTFSVTTNTLVGSSREAPSLFPKYSQSAAKAKEVEPAGCFCKSFKYPGTDPINSTETEKQPSLSLPSVSVCLSVSQFLSLSVSVSLSLSLSLSLQTSRDLKESSIWALANRNRIPFCKFNAKRLEVTSLNEPCSVTVEFPKRSLREGTGELSHLSPKPL